MTRPITSTLVRQPRPISKDHTFVLKNPCCKHCGSNTLARIAALRKFEGIWYPSAIEVICSSPCRNDKWKPAAAHEQQVIADFINANYRII